MSQFTPCIIVRPKHAVNDPAARERMYLLAASGMSRLGVAAVMGLSHHDVLQGWLTRGKARPDDEPCGEFARRYVEAERLQEGLGVHIQSEQLRHIAAKPVAQRSLQEIAWVDRHLSRRYPKEHGSGEGLAQLRQLDPDLDLDAWWQKQGLEQEQLQALLREPPESLRLALIAEADTLLRICMEGGWRPPRRVRP